MRFVGPWPLLSLQPHTHQKVPPHTHTGYMPRTFIHTRCMPFTHYFSTSLISCQESEMECYGADT